MERIKSILRKIWSILWSFIEVVIIVYVICITACLLLRNKFGYTQIEKYSFVTMQEDTYEYIKDAKEGDLLVVKSSKKIVPGDLIFYYININNQYVVKSGFVKEVTQGETTALYVLNDEQNTTVASTKVLGKEYNLYPTWGTVYDVLTSRLGFLFLVLLPILIVFIYQVYEFVMVLKFEEVEKVKIKDTVKPETPVVEEKVVSTTKAEEEIVNQEEKTTPSKVEDNSVTSFEKDKTEVKEKPDFTNKADVAVMASEELKEEDTSTDDIEIL